MGKRFTKEYQPEGKGRPKGSISFSKIIKQIWTAPIDDLKEDMNDAPKIRVAKSVIALMKRAEKGDTFAFKTLMERVEGMPKLEMTVTQRGKFEELEGMSDDEILAKVKELQ